MPSLTPKVKAPASATWLLVFLVFLLSLVIFAATVFVGGLFWGWIWMLVTGAATHWNWGFWHSVFPYGLVTAFVIGVFNRAK